jgi:hypothetical protein
MERIGNQSSISSTKTHLEIHSARGENANVQQMLTNSSSSVMGMEIYTGRDELCFKVMNSLELDDISRLVDLAMSIAAWQKSLASCGRF